ncbi:hypothetical protein Q3G72_014084 [Acer saccharum]|nr:hypothetical protein Q3G72_014084 [Acer saccharum]
MDEFQRSDVPNMVAHLDDIGEGFTQIANTDTSPPRHFSFQDTTGNQHILEYGETEPQFNYNSEGAPNQYDEQFDHVQRLVPPPCAFYSINSGEVAPIRSQVDHQVGNAEKEASDDVGVLLTEMMASNLTDEEVVDHRSTTVASWRSHSWWLAGRATRRRRRDDQRDSNSTATGRDREVSGKVGRWFGNG